MDYLLAMYNSNPNFHNKFTFDEFVQMQNMQEPSQGITSLPQFDMANLPMYERDDEQVDYIGSQPNRFQQGLGKLFELFQRFSPIGNIAKGIESIRDRFDTRQAIIEDIARDTQGGPITTFRNIEQQQQDKIDDRGRGEIPTRSPAPSRPSTTYQDAKTAFTSSR